jgi:hypothetical protein
MDAPKVPKGRSPGVRTRFLPHPAAWLCGLTLLARPSSAGEPTAQDLIALAPAIRSDDRAVRTIELAGHVRHEGKLSYTFRAFYKAPGRFAFATFGGYDGIPIYFAADREMFSYEPVRPELTVFHDVAGYCFVGVKDGKYEMTTCGIQFVGHKLETIEVDLKPFFLPWTQEKNPAEARVVKTGDRQYTLIRRSEGVYYRARIDLSRPIPFTTFEVAQSPTGEATYAIDKIVVNGELDEAAFRFPALDRLPGGLKVHEVRSASIISEADGASQMMRAFQVRRDLHEPPLKRGILGPAMMGIRWDRARENDARYGAAVRGLVSLAPVPLEYDRPVATDDPDAIRRTGFDVVRDHLPKLPYKVSVEVK